MPRDTFEITLQRFTELFEDFTYKAKSSEVKKLPYDTWRVIQRAINSATEDKICVLFCEHDIDEKVIRINYGACKDLYLTPPEEKGKKSFYDILVDEKNFLFMDAITSAAIDTSAHYTYSNLDLDLTSETCNYYGYPISQLNTTYTSIDGTSDCSCTNTIDNTISLVDYVNANWTSLTDEITRIAEETVAKYNNNNKENKTTMTNFINFDFGPVSDNIHMSPYGMAIKNANGTYVSYNKATHQIMNVDIINFSGMNKFIYKVPVALSAVAEGDIIIHNKVPMFVTGIAGNSLNAIDIFHGEAKTILPARSPFGFDFITKVVSLIDMSGVGSANADNPFGNMLPLFLMGESDLKDSDAMFMYMMTMGGQNSTNIFNNPMMLYFMMNDKGDKMSDMLPVMLMMNGDFGCNCGETHTSKVVPTPVNT